jgi:hypothetical protein
MPSYTMRHKETGETKDVVLTISERDTFLEENPDWEQTLSTPGFVSSHISTMRRAGSEWNNVLKDIKKNAGRKSTINT